MRRLYRLLCYRYDLRTLIKMFLCRCRIRRIYIQFKTGYDMQMIPEFLLPVLLYMNLRILELMWTQVRQIMSQEDMMKCANTIISRVQLFAERFQNVEQKMAGTLKEMEDLKKVTAESGQSIVVAAKGLLKAGARVDKSKKKSGNIFEEVEYLEDNDTRMLEN